MKKWIVTLILLLSVVGLRYSDPWILETVRMKALDVHQQNQETVILEDIVTVEIDNKTMDKNGQWPQPREIMQRELIKLFESGAGLVVMPILFSQPDRGGKDKEFAELLAQLPVVIGQIPANEAKGNPVPRGVAVIGGNGEDPPWTNWIYEYNSAVGPVKEIGDVALAHVRKLAASSPRSRQERTQKEDIMKNEGTNLFAALLEEKLRVESSNSNGV